MFIFHLTSDCKFYVTNQSEPSTNQMGKTQDSQNFHKLDIRLLQEFLIQGYANLKMTHSGWIPTSTKLTKAQVTGLTDEACKEQLSSYDTLGFYQTCAAQAKNDVLAGNGGMSNNQVKSYHTEDTYHLEVERNHNCHQQKSVDQMSILNKAIKS